MAKRAAATRARLGRDVFGLEQRLTPAYDPFNVAAYQYTVSDGTVSFTDGDPDPTDGIEDTAGYQIFVDVNGTTIDSYDTTNTQVSFSGLDAYPNSRVDVTVYAYDFDGNFSNGVTSSFNTESSGSVSLTASSNGTTNGYASWTSDISTDWNVYVAPAGGSYSFYTTTSGTSTSISGLAPATTYYVYVEGVNAFGDTIQSNADSFTTDSDSGGGTVGSVSLTAFSTGSTTGTASWSPNFTSNWDVYLSEGGANYQYLTTTGGTSVNLINLQPATTYYVYVEGIDGSGTTVDSNEYSFVTDGASNPGNPGNPGNPPGGQAPSAPLVSISGTTKNSVSITIAGDGDLLAAYQVQTRLHGNGAFSTVATLSAFDTAYTVANLQEFTSYDIRVVETNLYGQATSNQAYAKTQFTPFLHLVDDNGNPYQSVIAAAPASGDSIVTVFEATSGKVIGRYNPYDSAGLGGTGGFGGGVYTAVGDMNGDGVLDVITGTGNGGGPRVTIYSGADFSVIFDNFVYESAFRGGVIVAAGDVNGDGVDDLITGTGVGGGPRVRIFAGGSGPGAFTVYSDFFAYEDSFRGGVLVAAADVNGDHVDEVITGTGVGGGPRVRVLQVQSGGSFTVYSDSFAFEDAFRGGVFVAGGDTDGDGRAETIHGTGHGGGPRVTGQNFATGQALPSFFTGPTSSRDGAGVGFAYRIVNGVKKGYILSAPGVGQPAVFGAFDPVDGALAVQYDLHEDFLTGVYVGGGSLR